MGMPTNFTRETYIDLFDSPSEAIEFENSTLSVGREYLPACALAVLDDEGGDHEPGPDYWAWLTEQVAGVATTTDEQDLLEIATKHLTCGKPVHTLDARGLHLYYDDACCSWWMVSNEDLVDLGRMLSAEVRDAYSHWCNQTSSVEIDLVDIVNGYDADEDTDLDALQAEAGAADDMVSHMALLFLRNEVEEIIAQNAEIAAEVA